MDTSQAKQAIAAVNRQFEAAVRQRDFAAVAALYTEDGRVMPPDAAIVKGRAAIKAFWQKTAEVLQLEAVALNTQQLDVSGDMAAEVGEAELTLKTGAATVKYVVVWRRGGDGVWRLQTDIWNGTRKG